jgi:hypothetical protein
LITSIYDTNLYDIYEEVVRYLFIHLNKFSFIFEFD